ncbi:MAG: hypothetical protein KatS3mg027_0750 [Bacteroidia bacterium]|nr:MAG: hypothetical protein KatS3mg027_0750 [Bacteroidia bacterium]
MYKHINILTYLNAFIYLFTNLMAQTKYDTDSRYFQKPSPFYFLNDTTLQITQYIDTSVLSFQYSLPFYFNGQIGTAQPDYLLQQNDFEIGNRVLSVYYPDIITLENINIYKTKGFFAKLEGIAGSKDEQHFRAFFTSPIKQQHQINFFLRRSTNTGFYQHQKASITNLFTDYHWFGKKRFSMDTKLLLNFLKHQENGGITIDTLSYNDLFLDKTLVPVSLSSATKKYNNHTAELNAHYRFGKDTINLNAISIGIRAFQELYQYTDNYPFSGYYNFIFLDTIKTNDSLNSWKIELPLTYSFKLNNTIAQLTYYYQYNKIHFSFDTVLQNHFLEGKTFHSFQYLKFSGNSGTELKYIINGTQKNNYYFKVFSNIHYKKWSTEMQVSTFQQSPTFQQNFWYSNHFIWENHFQNILTSTFHFSLAFDKFIRLSYTGRTIKNFVYFLDNYPQQYTNNLMVHQWQLQLNFLLLKHIGIKSNYYYQWKSADVIALPQHFLDVDLYYQGRWFKNNLLVNTGVQFISALNYFDTYQYNPATSIYSVMSRNFQTGNYPQIGLYFSGRIKPVNFFIRMDNLLSGFIGQPYYYLPHYMMPDRALRMGISWMFFD